MSWSRYRSNASFDRFEWGEDEEDYDGISREEYEKFKVTLPREYQLRLYRCGDWQAIAEDEGVLQLEEFIDLVDSFVEDIAMYKADLF